MATDDVSLSWLPGEIHALVGPNGAGISTLIKQIAGGLAPESGTVWFDGRNDRLRNRAEAALARVGLRDRAATRTGKLSHGQRRLQEVAVALTLQPKVFLMAEPKAGLGFEGSKRTTGFFWISCVITPRSCWSSMIWMRFLPSRTGSLCLFYGKVIATGTVAESRRNPEVRTAYLDEEAAT